jgi:hypothetical protein
MRHPSSQLREWARLGARTRLQEIDRERAAILASFPDLRHARAQPGSGGLRKRRKMSAAARRRQAAGMKKYWAKRKAAEAKSRQP